MDEDLIRSAKIYALKQGKSLSSIVQEHFKRLLNEHSSQKEDQEEPLSGREENPKSWVEELRGSVKQTDFRSDDEIKLEYLTEKYLK